MMPGRFQRIACDLLMLCVEGACTVRSHHINIVVYVRVVLILFCIRLILFIFDAASIYCAKFTLKAIYLCA